MADRQDFSPASNSPVSLIDAPMCPGETAKHIVMWNVRGTDETEREAAIALVKSLFEALVGIIPGLLRIEVGVDSSRVDYACDVVLVSEFEDGASLAAYAAHPAHLAIRDRLTGIRTERYQVDYRSPRWRPDRAAKSNI